MQEARKATGLAVTDRISLWWSATDAELAAALREHADTVTAEVLATSYQEGDPDEQLPRHGDPELGLTFALRRA